MQFPAQVVVDPASSLCSCGWRPLLMTGFLVQTLRYHFADANNIEEPALDDYLWRTNLSGQKILIESLTRWLPAQSSSRPAVLVRRNEWQIANLGIGGNRLQGQTAVDGSESYNVLVTGSHTLFCLSREAGECETLAAEVYRELLGFAPTIREYLDLLRFQVAVVGQMMPVLEAREHFGIPVTVAYAHNQTWTVRKQAPVLAKIELDLFRP